MRSDLRKRGEPLPEELLTPYPHPKSIGLFVDPKTRGTIAAITPGSIAEQSGLQVGDVIVRVESQPILSIADIQWVLHQTTAGATKLSVEVKRGSTKQPVSLSLPDHWRELDDTSWRVSSWGLARMATGGMRLEPLDQDARTLHSIPDGVMALRVKSVGQYGPHATAKNAGFKVDDILTAFDEHTNLMTEAAVFRYAVNHRAPGEKVAVSFMRGKEKHILNLPMQP